MKDWNGRTVFVEADSGGDAEKNPSNSVGQFLDARRRHNLVTRIHAAREQGLLHEASQFSQKDVEAAANELLGQLKTGRITRQHIEMEQRQDMDRLAGWKVVAPAEGTELRRKMEAVQYRMTVRAAALDAFAKQELTTMTSTTGHRREVTDPVTRRPWRPGVGSGDTRY